MPSLATHDRVEAAFSDKPPVGPVRSALIVLSVAVAVLLILGVPALVNWTDKHATGSGGRTLPDPALLEGTVQKTTAVVQLVERFTDRAGFVGIVADNDHEVVTVLWKGAVPAGLSALVGKKPGGVQIKLVSASYSLAELRSAATALMKQVDAMRLPIEGITPRAASGRLVVTVNPDAVADLASLGAQLRRLTGVPLLVLGPGDPRARPMAYVGPVSRSAARV